jgi:hypothetical protein
MTALLGRLGRDAILMPSHVGDGAADAIWPWSDVNAESCW